MQFKWSLCSLLLLTALLHTNHVMAEADLSIELIELLGEIEDDDNMLELALAELEQKSKSTTQTNSNRQNQKQNPEIAAPAGGSKK